jgi:type IV secretion system protein VirD4
LPYQSHLRTVTPDIQTPVAVGQYQHGSAKWLTNKEKDKAFESFVLDPNAPQIKELLWSGYDELDFMKA